MQRDVKKNWGEMGNDINVILFICNFYWLNVVLH